MELRKYQLEAKEAILNEWNNGIKKTLLVLPTGTGKTIVFSKVIEDKINQNQKYIKTNKKLNNILKNIELQKGKVVD